MENLKYEQIGEEIIKLNQILKFNIYHYINYHKCNTWLPTPFPPSPANNPVTYPPYSAKDQITAILKSTGSNYDEAQVANVIDTLKGKDITQLINKGFSKVNVGGGGAPKAEEKKPK